MKKSLVLVIGAVTVYSAPATAQISLEANGARADGHWGGELGAGYGFGAGGFRLTPGGGLLIYSGHSERYYRDANGGNDRCLDSASGQYVDGSRCDDRRVRLYGRLEATYAIPLSATIGAGVRVSDHVRPYGTVAMPLVPHLAVKANVGPHYYALGLKLGL